MVTVAALFQKDPQSLLAHPGQGNDSLAALKGKPIMVGGDTRIGSWLFLKAKYGYTDDQIRPYTFNIAPFLADPKAVQQGYVTSEVYTMQQQGVKPVVMLLADNGYTSYAAMIHTSAKLVAEKPDLVQRFVDASIEGWYSYLYGNPAPGNALIKKDNPEHDRRPSRLRLATRSRNTASSTAATRTSQRHRRDERAALERFLHADVGAGRLSRRARLAQGLRRLQFVNKKIGMEHIGEMGEAAPALERETPARQHDLTAASPVDAAGAAVLRSPASARPIAPGVAALAGVDLDVQTGATS